MGKKGGRDCAIQGKVLQQEGKSGNVGRFMDLGEGKNNWDEKKEMAILERDLKY